MIKSVICNVLVRVSVHVCHRFEGWSPYFMDDFLVRVSFLSYQGEVCHRVVERSPYFIDLKIFIFRPTP